MRAYDVALFVHLLGLIALFGGFVIYARAGPRLRAAASMDQVQTWLGLLESTKPMLPSGSLMLLASGFYMTATRWRSVQPWIVVALVGLVAIGVLVGTVGVRHLRAMRAAAVESQGAIPAGLARVISDPLPWSVMAALNGAALGIVWLMTTKPGWAGSIGVLVAGVALGAVIGLATVRGRHRGAPRPAHSAGS